MATTKDVAEWMAQSVRAQKELYQEIVVYEIESRFGSEFVYYNDNGNPAIAKKVLRKFRELTPDVVWERRERRWRPREPGDPEGRQVDA